ncbi:MAG: class I SAM-dependent RNA methyltransferase [Chloroflexi bacterium]|nr:MAG: class I SAM-dependent RNA methyltransferase [Chloroflexota bacterium]
MPQTIDLELTAMAHGGSALGRHEGRVIFVPYAIPGERVRVELVEEHQRWARARLVEILRPSPHRVQPPCPYFGQDKCGGCQWQHISYEEQLRLKAEVVADQLLRIGELEVAVEEPIGAEEPWSYRNHAQFYVTEDGHLGFLTIDSRDVIPVEECYIIDSLLDDLWMALDMYWPQLYRLTLRCGVATGELMAVFELDHYEDFDIEVDFPVSCVLLLADGETAVLMGEPHFREEVAGREYRISAGSVFQVNSGGAEALVTLVRELLAPGGDETLLDLFSGVGLFGLALAGDVGRVIAVEEDPGAAGDLLHNARDLANVELRQGEVREVLAGIQEPVQLLVLDPPRAGAGQGVLEEIVRLAPGRIAYVSADPASLARDARHLVGGGYRLARLQPVDLFPQTFHIGSVALFVRET